MCLMTQDIFFLEDETTEFLKRLPNLDASVPTCHFAILITRSRITKEVMGIKTKDTVLARKIIKPVDDWRKIALLKIFNLAVLQRYGVYTSIKDGREIAYPWFSKGIMMPIKPRNVANAASDLAKHIIDTAMGDDKSRLARIDTEFYSKVHSRRDNSQPKYVTVDIDNAEIYPAVRDYLTPYKLFGVHKTARGYHCIVEFDNAKDGAGFYGKGGTWEKLREKFGKDVELQRDGNEPVPGTYYHNSSSKEPNFVRIIE